MARKVLVVDDSGITAKVVEALRNKGYETEVFKTTSTGRFSLLYGEPRRSLCPSPMRIPDVPAILFDTEMSNFLIQSQEADKMALALDFSGMEKRFTLEPCKGCGEVGCTDEMCVTTVTWAPGKSKITALQKNGMKFEADGKGGGTLSFTKRIERKGFRPKDVVISFHKECN